MIQDNRKLICVACNKELIEAQVFFSYMGQTFHANVPRCPACKQVYLPETLVKGQMASVEMLLEDK